MSDISAAHALLTCSGGVSALRLEFSKTVSLVFNTFSFKLFVAAQVAMCPISCCRVLAFADGMTRYVSSANLISELPE